MTKIAVLANPKAGGGRAIRRLPEVVSGLTDRGADVSVLTGDSADHALELAGRAVADGLDVLVAVGGDGSVSIATAAIGDSDTALGVVPLGTGNDNARSFGLPLRDPAAAVEVIVAGHSRLVDVAVARTADGAERRFTGVLSAGFDSQVNERANGMTFPPGRAKYLTAIVAQLAGFKASDYEVRIEPGGQVVTDAGMLVAVGNGPAYGGGMLVCPAASVTDGRLHVTFLHEVGIPLFLTLLPRVFSGAHVRHPSVTVHSGREVTVAATGQLAYADGERIGELPVRIELLPARLRVLVPAG